jgi:rubrerythrin
MGTKEMLSRSITYEEALLRTYNQYIVHAEDTEIGSLFARLAREKKGHIEELRTMLKRYCKP